MEIFNLWFDKLCLVAVWAPSGPRTEVSKVPRKQQRSFGTFWGKTGLKKDQGSEPRSGLKLPILSLCSENPWNHSLGDKCWVAARAGWQHSKEYVLWWLRYQRETEEKNSCFLFCCKLAFPFPLPLLLSFLEKLLFLLIFTCVEISF